MDGGDGSDAAAAATGATESGEATAKSKEEVLLSKTQKLISKITVFQESPSPRLLHALASMVETEEFRYVQDSSSLSFSNDRASHIIGRLGNLVQENDEFYELISSKFLSENGYSVSVRAAAARLLLSLSSTRMCPHVFDDAVLNNIKSWVMDDSVKFPDGECHREHGFGINKSTDSEMLKTYAVGLLSLSLAGDSQELEDILISGLSAKLMHYMRTRVVGEANIGQNDASFPAETRHSTIPTSMRGREENRGRSRQVLDAARLDGVKTGDGGHAHGKEFWGDGCASVKSELADSSSGVVGLYDMVEEDADPTGDGWEDADITGDGWHSRDMIGERYLSGRSARDEDAAENVRDDLPRRRFYRGLLRTPISGLRLGGLGRDCRDNFFPKSEDIKNVLDGKRSMIDLDRMTTGEDNDDRFRECNIGSRNITDMVKKAVQTAEAEARAADAPAEAIEAAGNAAAEFVKTAALEAWKSTNDEEAAVLAASYAASTIVNAAITIEGSQNRSNVGDKSILLEAVESGADEEFEYLFILDDEPLAQLREKYSIQCLVILGEYVEALGPVLQEKGVDVCLALLQRSFKDEHTLNSQALLPEVLKLISNLAAHRKFAALFVDRGGIEKLLSIKRVPHTFFGLSSCLFTIGSLQGIMERVCALPSDVVHRVVELALQLLEYPHDQARKNAAIFFAAAFIFRAVLDSFDARDGLHKMLNLLRGAALRNNRSSAEVLTASEKQIAYHTCVALHQYFRARLLLVVDSLHPNKSCRGVARSTPSTRAAYKPLDISNEAMDAVFLQIQLDRKLGPAFVRAPWPAVDKFLTSNGHITMLELCQAPPVERYLHDLAQYALGVLHIVTFVPESRKLIVNATLSNDREGMTVILDAANGAGYADPEVIHAALNVLVNLVCPPPSISNNPSVLARSLRGQQPVLVLNGEPNLFERDGAASLCTSFQGNSWQSAKPAMSSVVVGFRRIGPGASCDDLAAQLEEEYCVAREAVRANNGIKVLLHLLHTRMITPPASLDRLRALACRVLLGLARDITIAHILTKLQVGKKLSELIRDSGIQASRTEQGRWQSNLAQVAIELIAIVTNSGHASTLVATEAAAPTLRRIERAAIAAATPITYHSRELLLLIHEHLQVSGLTATAALLQREADLIPLPSFAAVAAPPPLRQTSSKKTSLAKLQWPSGRAPCGFLSGTIKTVQREEVLCLKSDSDLTSSREKPLLFSFKPQRKGQLLSQFSSIHRTSSALKSPSAPPGRPELPNTSILLPMKRKLTELRDVCPTSAAKRLATTDFVSRSLDYRIPISGCRNCLPMDAIRLSSAENCTPKDPSALTTSGSVFLDNSIEIQYENIPRVTSTIVSQLCLPSDPHIGSVERMTLDSLVVQYLKHQHLQCPAPIATLPPLSLLQPHVCPFPVSSCSVDAPANVTARLSTRECRKEYYGIPANRRDRQSVYSRFRPFRTCRDDTSILTSLTFLGSSSRIATGSHSGELKIFDSNNGNVLESHSCHRTPIVLVQSSFSGESQMVLSSGTDDVRLWDASAVSSGPLHSFEGCKAARFSHSATVFAALSTEASCREVIIYDIQTSNVVARLSDSSNNTSGLFRGHGQWPVHFSPLDTMLLWNGVLWDRRSSDPVHRFDQLTDYRGGGFHPAGNQVIINSEVWDLRKFTLLQSVPSLDQTVITFNAGGDVIYAILRRNLDDITSAVNTRRVRHPLFPAFRTVDAVNYSDIATVPVERCVLDFAADPADLFVGVVTLEDKEEMLSSARIYEIGRRRPNDDDSDPNDEADTDEDDDDEGNGDSEADVESILGADMDGDGDDSDAMGDDDDNGGDGDGDDDDNGDDLDGEDTDFEGGQLEMMDGDEDGGDDDSEVESFSSGEEED